MMKCRLLLQKLIIHIIEMSNQSELNFGVAAMHPLCVPIFKETRLMRDWEVFVVDLVWNDPINRSKL